MANGEQVPAKQGLPVWAWVGIGCGALIVLVMIAIAIGGIFIANKAKDVAADFEKDPAMVAARMIVKLNPELEEVDSDPDAGTMTVRNKQTGEVITVDLEDIKEGRLSFKSGDREINIDASEMEGSGTLKITDEDGGVVFSSGDVSQELPAFVPVYPGCEPANRHSMTTGGESIGGFELETSDSVQEVLEFYRSKLEAAGFETSVNTFSQDGSRGGMVNANEPGANRTVTVIINSEGASPTKVVVSFQRRTAESEDAGP